MSSKSRPNPSGLESGESYWAYWLGEAVIITYESNVFWILRRMGPIPNAADVQIISHIEKPPENIKPINGETYWLRRKHEPGLELGMFIAESGRWLIGGVSYMGGGIEPLQHVPRPLVK
jgi:hypothetical protein